jgi:MFS family permease
MPNPIMVWRRLPKLVRFLVCHAAVGFALAAIFVGAILLLDPQDAGTLLMTAAGHWWPAVVLWFFTGLTFGAVQIGAATMLLEHAEPHRPHRAGGAPAGLVPVLLRVRRRR